MEDSILLSVKSAAGLNDEDSAFDDELILHINSVFMKLRQLGVGPDIPFIIEDDGAVWEEFTTDSNILPMVKSYVTLSVRLLFDPPTSGQLMTSMQEIIAEYEWRLNFEADKYKVEEDEHYVKYFKQSDQ